MTAGAAFLHRSGAYLDEYLTKIRFCLDELTDDDLWWRPNEASNSIGNLMLHLAGNLRQWVVSGVGGAGDTRERGAEFAERGPVPRAELFDRLEETVREARGVLEKLDETGLAERRAIQGRDVSVLDAVYHVVEHFAMHTGQIIFLAKARTGRGLGFYRDADGLAEPIWEKRPR